MTLDKDIVNLLNQFANKEENKNLIARYQSETVFDIIGKVHNETVHSNFIKWYFEQSTYGVPAIKRLISLAESRSKTSGSFPKELDRRNLDKYSISKIEVKREVQCAVNTRRGKKKGKVDIVISLEIKFKHQVIPLRIIIENKIFSTHHDHQTYVYYTYFSNINSKCEEDGEVFMAYSRKPQKYSPENNKEIQLFLYLTVPVDMERHTDSICNEFIHISYQDMYDHIFLKDSSQNQSQAHKRQQLFLEEYRRNLIKPYIDNNNKIRIMAYDKKDISILEDFWDTNLPLFKLAAEVISRETADEEKKERISTIIQGIDSLGKNYNLFNLILPNGDSYKNQRMKVIAKKIVEFLLNKRASSSINDLLPKEIRLISADEYNQKKKFSIDPNFAKKWDKLESVNLYLSNQWTSTRFEEFIGKLSEHYEDIKVETI